VLFFATNSIKI